ncbi:hypothetical protein A3A76_00975 [Candidatus Woesebacteria bacterium RIFCSPLOWO2_01_FULL_39_23]|uniref:Uncharacterized protein n=1 Tax=Candidatus Woesebacteria bacterium RIFCSPHIGHO2_01_FULL_40_22 TaxID=1802499 RepID=A0A1F7YHH7_9BACT|nr:MAG: hypothetical protein A2141_05620 [Candidatus Woesebacteria bacterium RBG_16_40_11]OGM26814.1 MAG: hypothetical protein A2628_04650 [Candidatus Woesebacteria bacterium RIFCSPHIGHO2_01_FULL_40_22]OGM38384.1 MAG: hypothetical protein A3E41_02465 [Candidatus Woesebacteria bacterium RIFCSPHIGHO2_12_FULL_38_9]OGM63111.1 MAG: hypothetical protein A3A76_00975 [Candidatus Woesebacteria bacterium RIFCSPLOWO2_01_FULL_39_23]
MDRLFELFGRRGKQKLHEEWRRKWEEHNRRRSEHIDETILGFFKERGVVRTSVPIDLVNAEGEVIGTIEPNEK